VIVAALLVVFGLAAEPHGQGTALDPGGTGPDGAKAVVLLLRHYGATVTLDRGLPPVGTATALVLRDQLGGPRRRAIADWVAGGGRLVVADPTSALETGAATPVDDGLVRPDLHPVGPCPALGLGDVVTLSVGASLLLRVPPAQPATACYDYTLADHETASFIVATRHGAGTVIGLGGAGVWTNSRLGQDDNAALAVDLLAPGPADHLDVLVASPAGSGTTSVLALLSPRLTTALVELVVAFVLLAWWRGRRLGQPVDEVDPVQLAGSEIVVAVGELLSRTANRDAAAQQLRDGARAWIGERLGLGPRAGPEQISDAVAARTGGDRQVVLGLLADAPVPDDAALVGLAQSLAQLRQEAAGGRSPTSI
jgi:hypothetical protein